MSLRKAKLFAVLTPVMLCFAHGAQAQFAVIDVASVTQLIQQVETLKQQLDAARQQITQAQAIYQSTTGARGMGQLLSGVTRNYLPADWAQLMAVQQGAVGGYGVLASQIDAMVSSNSVLSAAQLAAQSSDAQAQINAERRAVALLQGLTQQALSNSSDRFTSLQQLIAAIPAAVDQKGILDLQARINAEQAMLQNERTKLQTLYQAAQSQGMVASQRAREQIIAGQGHFSTRFEPSPL